MSDLTVSQLRPIGARVLARRYERPEQIRGIWVPEGYKHDPTLSLWEVVRSSPRADTMLGHALAEGDIVYTRPRAGVMLSELVPTMEGADIHAFLPASQIYKVLRWKENEAPVDDRETWTLEEKRIMEDDFGVTVEHVYRAPSSLDVQGRQS